MAQNNPAEEALEQYCNLQSWQVKAIEAGIQSADAGELYSTETILAKLDLKQKNVITPASQP